MGTSIMESVVSKEVAIKELDSWLDFHEINEDQKKDCEVNVSVMLAGIQSGRVVINTDNTVTQKLKHPFGKEKKIELLTYTNGGLPIGEISNCKEAISKDNDNRNSIAHISVATATAVDIINKMSSKDLNTAAAIIIFFML